MKILTLLFLTFFFAACTNTRSSTDQVSANTVEENLSELPEINDEDIDLSWVGKYKGVFLCDDCDALLVDITLNADESYERLVSFLGKDELEYDDYLCSWHFQQTILLMNEEFDIIDQYQLSNDTLYKLDGGYNRLTGKDAGKYNLVKVD